MNGSTLLIHLAGAIALLLWATRMVRTGVERAYGDLLRRKLRGTLQNPLLAVLAGASLAIAFQSSTAVSLLVGSFVGSGIVSAAAGLVAVLGADLGSALVVRLLSFNLSLLIPIALCLGTSIFLATERRTWRQFGRILVGVGLLLLSLQLIGAASDPLRESRILPEIISHLAEDPATAFLLAALMTWLFHSSVAFILLVVALATRGLVPIELGLVLILGANLGGGIIAAMLARTLPASSRIIPFSNLLIRGLGALLMLVLLSGLQLPFDWLGSTPALQLVHGHILFNLLMLLLALPLVGKVCQWMERLLAYMAPATPTNLADRETSALDPSALGSPSRALANVTRAVVNLCETLEIMLKSVMPLYDTADRNQITELAALDDRVDRKHAAIKLYLARITTRDMSPAEARRTQELLDACIRLEQAGDIIVRNLLAHARKKLDRGLKFNPEGWHELSNLHASVLTNARLAFNVLISRDVDTALLLVREKDRLRDLERETSQRHFERLREETTESIETSALHLDTVRDLKQINTLLTGIAYPILEEQGLLNTTRLKATHQPPADSPDSATPGNA